MNHDEAIRLMASEKYVLGELSADLREQFEEHFFECEECALDLRATQAFIAHSHAALAAPVHATAVPADKGSLSSNWLAWLRPAFVVPAFAILLAVVAYQNLVTYSKLKHIAADANSPRILASAVLLGSNTRGGTLPSVTTRTGDPFLLLVDVPAEPRFQSYVAELISPRGNSQWLLTIPADITRDTVSLRVPPQADAGTYTLLVRGVSSGSAPAEVVRCRFELNFQK